MHIDYGEVVPRLYGPFFRFRRLWAKAPAEELRGIDVFGGGEQKTRNPSVVGEGKWA